MALAPPVRHAHFWYGVVATTLLAFACEHLVLRVPLAHAGLAPLLPRPLPLGSAALGAIAGMWPRSGRRAAETAPWRLCALALVGAASGPLWFFAFDAPAWFAPLLVALPAVAAWLTVGAARGALHAVFSLGRIAPLPRFGPLRILAFCALWFCSHAALEFAGFWQQGALLASALSVLAAWFATLHEELEGRAYPHARVTQTLAALCFALAACSTVAAGRALPSAREIAQHSSNVLYAASGPERAIVARSPLGHELWLDRALRVSALDPARYFEPLVHPAMTFARRVKRVLVVSPGEGLAEREVLRYPEVQSVTSLVFSRDIYRLARELPWLRELSAGSLSAKRVRVVVEEPSAWLDLTSERFDVVLLDVPDPEGYLQGKYYTRYFYRRMLDRLSPNGIVAVQATSAFTTPKTASTIEATLKAAGFRTRRYHAPVESYGIWTFILASRAALPSRARRALPPRLEYLNRPTLAALFVEADDLALDATAAPSLLYYQRVVHLFERERQQH